MNTEEVVKFVTDAVDYVESNNTKEQLPKARKQLAGFLFMKFNIAIKDLQINMTDGNPYLVIEYLNDKKEKAEVKINMKKWENNFV